MKSIFRSYLTFSRTERIGIIALLVVILLLIAVRATMPLWVPQPKINAEEVAQTTRNKILQPQTIQQPPGTKINLNTADSLTLVSLPGIGKGLSHRILERRRQLGRFTHMQQVYDIYHFNEKTLKMLDERTIIE